MAAETPFAYAKRRFTEVVPDRTTLHFVACELITAAAGLAIGQRGVFRIALAGGSTPAEVYAGLAEDRDIDWRKWHLFWSDERCVSPQDGASNYRMVKEKLLDRLKARPGLVMRMTGEADPHAAAATYERIVREAVPSDDVGAAAKLPRFDLILLGMGGDGHIASLFPNSLALAETDRLVVVNEAPAPPSPRLTFTYPLINAARRVLLLVSGVEKAPALNEVLTGPYQPRLYPCQAIQPVDGQFTLLVDEAAFSEIDATLAAQP